MGIEGFFDRLQSLFELLACIGNQLDFFLHVAFGLR